MARHNSPRFLRLILLLLYNSSFLHFFRYFFFLLFWNPGAEEVAIRSDLNVYGSLCVLFFVPELGFILDFLLWLAEVSQELAEFTLHFADFHSIHVI